MSKDTTRSPHPSNIPPDQVEKLTGMLDMLEAATAAALELKDMAEGIGGIVAQVADKQTGPERKPHLQRELQELIDAAKQLGATSTQNINTPHTQDFYSKKLFENAIPKVVAQLAEANSMKHEHDSALDEVERKVQEASAALMAIVDEMSDSRKALTRELATLEVARENILASNCTLEELDGLVDHAKEQLEGKAKADTFLPRWRSGSISKLSMSR
jgi:chromosome segregation ATPase